MFFNLNLLKSIDHCEFIRISVLIYYIAKLMSYMCELFNVEGLLTLKQSHSVLKLRSLVIHPTSGEF